MITALTLSNQMLTVVLDNGKQILTAPKDHPKWDELVKAYDRYDEVALLELLSMKRVIEKYSVGNLVVSDQGVFYGGTPLGGVDVDRLLAFMREGHPYTPIANYMSRKFLNPSKRAIDEMYSFLEHRNMPLTPEGKIIAYKGVLPNFFSVSSGKEPLMQGRRNETGQIFNGVGETIEMDRCWVDDNFLVDCSGGLHAGSLEYARNWARSCGGVIILIEIDPPDVVSVPADCNCSKLRCRKYKVIGIYDGPLPDTYTADFSTPSVPTPVTEEDSEEDEVCENCGNTEVYCSCDEEPDDSEICIYCNKLPVDCTCPPMGPAEPGIMTVPTDASLPTNPCLEAPAAPLLPRPEPENPEDIQMRQKIVAAICKITATNPNLVTDDCYLASKPIMMDSLDCVEVVMELETDFNVEIPDGHWEECQTVGDVIRQMRVLLKHPEVVTPTLKESTREILGLPTNTYTPEEIETQAAYKEGFELGKRNGTRRRKRVYRAGDEKLTTAPKVQSYIRGYNAGYITGRWDYVNKG